MRQLWESFGKVLGKFWENFGKNIADNQSIKCNLWESFGKTLGQTWDKVGRKMGEKGGGKERRGENNYPFE